MRTARVTYEFPRKIRQLTMRAEKDDRTVIRASAPSVPSTDPGIRKGVEFRATGQFLLFSEIPSFPARPAVMARDTEKQKTFVRRQRTRRKQEGKTHGLALVPREKKKANKERNE